MRCGKNPPKALLLSPIMSINIPTSPMGPHCIASPVKILNILFMLRFYGPVKSNGVMSSTVILPNHAFTGQALSSKRLTSIVHRNWQLPFLNQRKGENDRRKYFMINLHERMLPTSAGVEPATSWSSVGRRIQLSHRGRLKILNMIDII